MLTIRSTADLAELITRTRKAQGLTQAELAATAGVGIRFVRELEKGKETAHLGKTLAVLTMLGLVVRIEDRTSLEYILS